MAARPGLGATGSWQAPPLPWRAVGRQRAMDAARRARAALGARPEDPVADLLASIDARGRLPVVVLRNPPTTAGAYVATTGRPVVLVNAAQWPTRARFTLAHEL